MDNIMFCMWNIIVPRFGYNVRNLIMKKGL